LLIKLTSKLNAELSNVKTKYNSEYQSKMAELQINQYFTKLTPEQKHIILAKNQLIQKIDDKILDAKELKYQLQSLSFLNWKTKIAALSSQFQSALDEAIILMAPKAITFSVPRGTISNQADIDVYVAKVKKELEDLLKESSSIILK